MPEAIVLILIWTLIVVNSRREIWKHRAKMRQIHIDSLKECIELERDANLKLIKRIPGAVTLYRPTSDWPEDIDA